MVQRAQIVAAVAALAIGAAVVAGLTLGSGEAPIRVGPTVMSANDQVAIYTDVLVNFAGRPVGMLEPRAIRVSRTIYDTCMPRPPITREEQAPASGPFDPSVPPRPKYLPPPCGHTKVGRLKPDVEAALRESLARQGVDASFEEQGNYSLHQIVTEATGTPATDADDGNSSMTFHFKRAGGLWQLQSTTAAWILR